jgi:hypothetical protein
MKLSIQYKFFIRLFLCMLIGFFIGIFAVETQLKSLLLVFFGWAFMASYLVFRIKCPSCGKPVAYQGEVNGVSVYAGFCRNKCVNCGHDLTK